MSDKSDDLNSSGIADEDDADRTLEDATKPVANIDGDDDVRTAVNNVETEGATTGADPKDDGQKSAAGDVAGDQETAGKDDGPFVFDN